MGKTKKIFTREEMLEAAKAFKDLAKLPLTPKTKAAHKRAQDIFEKVMRGDPLL